MAEALWQSGNCEHRSILGEGLRRICRIGGISALVLCIALPVSACSMQKDEAVQLEEAALPEQKIDDIAKAFLENGNYPGVGVAIMKNGRIVYENGYGLASIESGEAVTAKTIFPIGSITKSFTGLAVAQLAAQGKVELEAPIGQYLDDLPGGWEAIKVRHLMDHTSGLFNYTNDPSIQATPGDDRSVAEMRAVWEARPLAFEPGSRWAYSNAGYFLLGLIIEKASGQSYAEYLKENVFEPFGLTKTSYPESVNGKPGASGYAFKDGQQVPMPEWSPTIPFSAGALLSTPGDIAKYIDAIHHSPSISDEVREIIYTRSLAGGERMTYSLGGLSIQPIKGRERLSHPGSIWGYQSFFAYYPEERLSVVVLTNGHNSSLHPSNLERKLERIAFGEAQPDYKEVKLTTELTEMIEGDYSTGPVEFISSTIGFANRDGTLSIIFGGVNDEIVAFPLRHVGDRKFVAYHDDELTVTFGSEGVKANTADIMMMGGQLKAKR